MNSERSKQLALWLGSILALLISMIILGGFTRLTESGLSMVDWRPITGWLPPLNEAAWEQVFADYRKSPEYLKTNVGMSNAEFRSIFWLEYLHRLLGRIIGVVFLVPMMALRKYWESTRIPAPVFSGNRFPHKLNVSKNVTSPGVPMGGLRSPAGPRTQGPMQGLGSPESI